MKRIKNLRPEAADEFLKGQHKVYDMVLTMWGKMCEVDEVLEEMKANMKPDVPDVPDEPEKKPKAIRIGKDIIINWNIDVSDGSSLEDKTLAIYMYDKDGDEYEITNFEVKGNTVIFGLSGAAMTKLGVYSFTLWVNKGEIGQTVMDYNDAFELVNNTKYEHD